jgi:two-component system, NtrC family, sensor kinase
MSALGQLIAGVAHELNNPINFIAANLEPAQEYIKDLLAFIDLYHDCYPEPHPKIQNWIEEADVDYVKEDAPKLIASMKLGCDRIHHLALSLRNFSRLDETALTTVDIHDGIESTLVILQHRLKATPDSPQIQIIRDYEQPCLLECYPSQLNQVFMNLLGNAIDALEEGTKPGVTPTIKIRTFVSGTNWVNIAIADNGAGIPEEIRARLFEPFFTTKPIGKGTGLGLSISHQIVTEKHHGKIECYSTPDQGTEFVVQIPMQQSLN